jgi:hypothetical protein
MSLRMLSSYGKSSSGFGRAATKNERDVAVHAQHPAATGASTIQPRFMFLSGLERSDTK